MQKIKIVTFLLLILILVTGCSSEETFSSGESTDISTNSAEASSEEASVEYKPIENIYGKTITAEMKIKSYGTVVFELYPEEAPKTVENFVSKVKEGFYDGLKFHRIISGYIVQGGEYEGKETLETVYGEFSANGIVNSIPHKRGILSMSRKSSDLNSATCQFFVCLETSESISKTLDGYYAAFGCVLSGMEILDEISKVKTNSKGRPHNDVVIESIKIVSDNYTASTDSAESSESETDISSDSSDSSKVHENSENFNLSSTEKTN